MRENMRYVHFSEICKKIGNKQNTWKSHIHVFLTSLIIEWMDQNQRWRIYFNKFARWRHREQSLPCPSASCCSCFVSLLLIIVFFCLFVNCPGSLHAGDAFGYRKNCFTFVSHHFLYEGVTLHCVSVYCNVGICLNFSTWWNTTSSCQLLMWLILPWI